MLKKMLGKKNSVSQDTSSSEDEETIKVEKRKKSSSTNLKAMFQVVPQKVASELHPKVRNHGEGPYQGLLLVESGYYRFHI